MLVVGFPQRVMKAGKNCLASHKEAASAVSYQHRLVKAGRGLVGTVGILQRLANLGSGSESTVTIP